MFSYGEAITFVSSVLLKNERPRMRGRGAEGEGRGQIAVTMPPGAKDAICFLAAGPVTDGGCKDFGFTCYQG